MQGNNTIILAKCLEEYKTSNEFHLADSDLFELFVITQITKQYDISQEDLEDSIVDGGQDGGIDSLLVMYNDDPIKSRDELGDMKITSSGQMLVFFVQSKTEKSFTESTLDKLLVSTPIIFDLSKKEDELLKRFNAALVDKIMLFRDMWVACAAKGASIKIGYYYACKSNENDVGKAFIDKVQQLKTVTAQSVAGSELSYLNLSSKQLFELFRSRVPEELKLTFKGTPLPITYTGGTIGYIGVVKLNDYQKFIFDDQGNVRESLFESNVRHFQGDVDVNKTIRTTLEKDLTRDFWWLNNGITIIASRAGHVGDSLTLKGVQIVNGLQTSFSIASYYKILEREERSILVKVIISEDKETIDKIISATNSQTAVSVYSLRATDDVQREIELYFEGKGYFYDRRKNYYRNKGKPIARIFSIQNAAQAINTIINRNPSTARARPTSLIKDGKLYSSIFDRGTNYQVYLNCCLIYQAVKKYVQTHFAEKANRQQASNFLYHITRIAVSVLLSKAYYSTGDVAGINVNLVPKNMSTVMELFENILTQYSAENPEANIINVAKSGKFDEFINQILKMKFTA